jgi:membrane protein implicated in regulation of membrane protease activity
MSISDAFHSPAIWVAISLVLLITETLSGDGSLLAFSISGFLTSFLLWMFRPACHALWIIAAFFWIGVVLAFFLRRLLKKTEKHQGDINTF